MTERLEDVLEEILKPSIVEHRHSHTIDIRSNWFFFSWVGLAIIILVLFWLMANQRQTINQYKDNDLKYRYIKMYGQTGGKYEELVREQTEKIEKAERNTQDAEILRDKVESLKHSK